MIHTSGSQRNYDAFISYKHDPYISRIAHAVLRKLEHYRPPKGSGAERKRLYLCIDDQNLATAGILNKQICEALDHSEYLIYLACPETLGSKYCLDEIRYFKKLHNGRLDNIIVLLIKGNPKDVLPQELCYEGCWESGEKPDPAREVELHWIDLQAQSSSEAIKKLNENILMIAAPLLHCRQDELIQRERQWKKQKRMIYGMFCVVTMAVSFCVIYTLWLTWMTDYRLQAEKALADGNDNMALFYYAKILSLNPIDEEARINAQILLQKNTWPMLVKEEEDSIILGNHVFPVDLSAGVDDSLLPVCTTTHGDLVLWKDGKKRYYYGDTVGNVLEELPGSGSYRYSGGQTVSDSWLFVEEEEPHYIFCWPENKQIEKLNWDRNFSGKWYETGVCALQPGIIAVSNFEALTFYQLKDGICRELYRLELTEIFQNDPAILEKYGISLTDYYAYDIWPSPDGAHLILSANFWYHSSTEAFCHSEAALFDANTYQITAVIKSDECLISDIIFHNNDQKLAIIYNNQNGILENRGYAAIYNCSGDLVFQTECNSDRIPLGGYFCGKVFLLCVPSATYLLDAETGKQLSEPLLLNVNQAFLTDDGQLAIESAIKVRYCRLIRYSGGTIEEKAAENMIGSFQNEMEMKYQPADNLWLFTSDDRTEICLADENGIIWDRFPIQNAEKENNVLALAYGKTTRMAFVLDNKRDLFCIPIDTEFKKFASGEKVSVHSGILDFSPAKDGVFYLDSYVQGQYYSAISNLMYITNDNFLFFNDPAVNYLGWIARPDIRGSFVDLISGESDYAVIISQKDEQTNFRFFSAKTGASLADITLGSIEDIFVSLSEENDFCVYSDGKWHDIWLGIRPAYGSIAQQLMDLSGYTLYGSRFKKNQTLEHAEAIMSPDGFGSWAKDLEWTFLSLQEAGGGKNEKK